MLLLIEDNITFRCIDRWNKVNYLSLYALFFVSEGSGLI